MVSGQQIWATVRTHWTRLRHEHGQDLVEYAMLSAFILVMAIVAITALGNTINDALYNRFVSYFRHL